MEVGRALGEDEADAARLRELEDGRRWRQSMLVAYEKGGPRTGRLIRAEFEREEATVSAPRERGVAKLCPVMCGGIAALLQR